MPANIRANAITTTRAAITDCNRAGEPRLALTLTSLLNHQLSEALQAGDH